MKKCKSGLHQYEKHLPRCSECRKLKAKRFYLNNKAKLAIDMQIYYLNNIETRKRQMQEWCNENAEKRQTSHREYYKINRIEIKRKQKIYNKFRLLTDAFYKIKCNIRTLIATGLKRQGYSKKSKTQELLGADFETVYNHLILTAMNNYGIYYSPFEMYEIDHIVPCNSANDESEFIALQHYSNLQWLTKEDNLAKGVKLVWTMNDSVTIKRLSGPITPEILL